MSVHLFKLLWKMEDKEQKQTGVGYQNFSRQLHRFQRFKECVISLDPAQRVAYTLWHATLHLAQIKPIDSKHKTLYGPNKDSNENVMQN